MQRHSPRSRRLHEHASAVVQVDRAHCPMVPARCIGRKHGGTRSRKCGEKDQLKDTEGPQVDPRPAAPSCSASAPAARGGHIASERHERGFFFLTLFTIRNTFYFLPEHLLFPPNVISQKCPTCILPVQTCTKAKKSKLLFFRFSVFIHIQRKGIGPIEPISLAR